MSPKPRRELIHIGVRHTVLALDSETGAEVWRQKLKGATFTGVVRSGDRVLATAQGEIWCLDAATGAILWHNPLKGLGFGLVMVATNTSVEAEQQFLTVAEQLRRQQAQRQAAT